MSKHTTLQRLRRMLELEQLHFPKGSERAAELVAKIERQRLAAAAPELLEACVAALAWWEEHKHDQSHMYDEEYCNTYDKEPDFVALARAAIAKAEGGAS